MACTKTIYSVPTPCLQPQNEQRDCQNPGRGVGNLVLEQTACEAEMHCGESLCKARASQAHLSCQTALSALAQHSLVLSACTHMCLTLLIIWADVAHSGCLLTIGFRQCRVHPDCSCQGNDCIQPEGARASQMLNQGQEGLADNSICDPVTGCSCTPTQTPQLHVRNMHIGSMQCSWIRMHAHVLTAAAAKWLFHWGVGNGTGQIFCSL